MKTSMEIYREQHDRNTAYCSEPNTCKYRHDGLCMMLGNEKCPSTVMYDDNNVNNVPCDLSLYKPQ